MLGKTKARTEGGQRATGGSVAARGRGPGTLLAGLILVLLPMSAEASDVPRDTPSLEQAEAALEDGRAADAEAEFRRLLLADPQSTEALLGWARALTEQERGAEALASLLRGGERLADRGDFAGAARLFELAAQIDGSSLEAQAGLARALVQERRFLAAEQPLRLAVELGHRDVRWLLQLAGVLWEKGDLDEAEALFREAVERTPGSGFTRYQLGRFLLWRGEFREAAEAIATAERLGERGFSLELDRGRALEGIARTAPAGEQGSGETREVLIRAREAFRHAVEMAPEHSGARFGLARVEARLGDEAEARNELRTFERLFEEDQERARLEGLERARLDQARRLVGEGRPEEALALLDTMPEGIESLRLSAIAARRSGDLERATAAVERALMLDPERTDLRALLVELRLEAERN